MTMLEYIRIHSKMALKKDAKPILFAMGQLCEKHAREKYY